MLYTIAAILMVLWLLGLVSSYTVVGFIHGLLMIAIASGATRPRESNNSRDHPQEGCRAPDDSPDLLQVSS